MPFTARDAIRHTRKAKSAKQRRQWAAVANSQLKAGKSDAVAIRSANAAIKATKRRKK